MAKPKKPTSKAAGATDTSKTSTDAADASKMKDVTPAAETKAASTAKKDTSAAAKSKASSASAATKSGTSTDPKTTADAAKPAAATTAASKPAEKSATTTAKSTSTASTAAKEADKKPEPAKPAPAKDAPKETPNAAAKPAASSVSQPAPPPQRSVFWPLVTGGLAAGVIGFIAAEMDAFGMRQADGDLQATISAQSERIAQLEESLGAASEAPDLAPLQTELSAVSGAVADLGGRIDALQGEVADLAARPIVTESGDVDVSAYEAQLSELQSSVTAQMAEVGELQASVLAQKAELEALLDTAKSAEAATAEAARLAVVQGALTDISAALTEGAPFSDALGVLAENGVGDVPDVLQQAAVDGVATMNALQTRFPDSARAALAVARSSGAQEGESGVTGFLRRSLGARSVAPREGSDPDAVLSRVEAAIGSGALDTALTEIETLPAEVQDALGAWLVDARARGEARTALTALSERLTAN